MLEPTHYGFAVLLAQAEQAPVGPGPLGGMLVPLVLIGILFYFMLLRPEQRKRATHEKMLDALKKNDRVVTVGGIHGTVVNVNKDQQEVTVKVDESSNTKLRINRSAISRVVTETSSDDDAEKK